MAEQVSEPKEALPRFATAPAQPAASVTMPVREPELTTVSASAYGPGRPPAPRYSESYVASEPPAPMPPPREKPEATDPAVRARLMGMFYGTPTVERTEEQLEPEGPETPELVVEGIADYESVQREREVLEYVGLKQRRELWNEVLRLYRTVPDVLCTDENLAHALRLLQEAQYIMLESPRQFNIAKYNAGQVRSIVTRRLNTSRWANTYGWVAFVYETLWIMVLILAVLLFPVMVNQIGGAPEGVQGFDPVVLSVLWNTMAWGGLGGVIGALYSLYWHVAKVRDFDKQYMMWYIVQPVIGVLLGGLVHLLLGSGLMAALGQTVSASEVDLSTFPYAVACIAGFRQRFILEIIDRIIQLLTPPPSEGRRPAVETASEETR